MRPANEALIVIDLQNDFLHPEGAYGRAGQTAPAIAALPVASLSAVIEPDKSSGVERPVPASI